MQTIKLYQAANNRPRLTSALYSTSVGKKDKHYPWLQPGYYFWENDIEDARVWGRIRYHDNYSIYTCSYKMDDQYCLDLVSNYRHKYFFKEVRDRLIEKSNGKDVSIEKIIKWILDNADKDALFKCVRLESKTFNPNQFKVPTPNGDSIEFNKSTVQVCFYDFPNELIEEPFQFIEEYPNTAVFG